MGGNLLHEEVLADDVAQAFVTSALLEETTGNVVTVDGRQRRGNAALRPVLPKAPRGLGPAATGVRRSGASCT
jgi:hypothetical protein